RVFETASGPTAARSGSGGMRSLIRNAVVVFSALLASAALAQQCTYEVEPNDTPAQATVVTGAGPDAVEAARSGKIGITCLAGELGSGDQDAFYWEIDEEAAAHVWQVVLEGPRGGLTQVHFFDIEFAENGVDVVRADQLFRFETTNGATATSAGILLQPGRYVLGLSPAGVDGEYVVNLHPRP